MAQDCCNISYSFPLLRPPANPATADPALLYPTADPALLYPTANPALLYPTGFGHTPSSGSNTGIFRYHQQDTESKHPLYIGLGDEVFLSTKHLALKVPRDGAPKLMPKWTGPFAISEVVNEVAYRLQLPANLKIHDVFHVSLLKPFLSDGRYQAPPPPISVDGELEYELECILNHRDHRVGRGSYRQYLVSWVNQGPHGNTWEFESDLTNCEEELRRYWHSQGWTSGATSPWSARGTPNPITSHKVRHGQKYRSMSDIHQSAKGAKILASVLMPVPDPQYSTALCTPTPNCTR